MKTSLTLLLGIVLLSVQESQSGSVNVGDAVIHYEITGAGTPLILIHGWAQDLSIWDGQVPEFARQYRVIRYDRRGYGTSTGYADRTADADDLRILLDSLGIRQAHVLGLSAGSTAGLTFAVAFPDRVRSVVLYGQSPPPGFAPMPADPTPVMVFRDIALRHGLDSAGRFMHAHQLAWMPPDRPDLRQLLGDQWARYSGRDLLDPHPESGRLPPVRIDQVHQIRVPTLIVSGDHELPLFLQVADTLVRRIPGAQRVMITNGGHGAHFAQPAQFNSAVLRFLRAADRKAP